MSKDTSRSLTLIGMPGSGKSKAGRHLADHFGWPFIDTDDIIVRLFGVASLQEAVDELSGPEFAAVEESVGIVAALRIQRPTIIATSGSMVCSERAMQFLWERTHVVYLEASLKTIERRVSKRPDRGIVFAPGETLADLYARRTPMYRRWAHRVVDANDDQRRRVGERLAESLSAEGIV